MQKLNANKVSVLIPAYNEEKYIIQTLEALIHQDYPDFEIIIINNDSTDNTALLLNNFIINTKCNQRIILTFENKRGTNAARETGRSIAEGNIIAQLDADCLPAPNWISTGVALLKTSNAGAVTGPYDYYDSSHIRRRLTLFFQKNFYPVVNKLAQYAKRGALLIGGNCFILFDVLKTVGGYDTSLTFYGDDIDLGARIAKICPVLYSKKLVLKTSSRRFNKIGFNKVQRTYRKFFWKLILGEKIKANESYEVIHPR